MKEERKKERESAKGKENDMGKKRKKKEKEKKEEEEEEKIEKCGTKSVLPSPETFSSTKLGNNITPIKERLGKNTTPTGRRSIGTETESPGGSPTKTTKPRSFIMSRF